MRSWRTARVRFSPVVGDPRRALEYRATSSATGYHWLARTFRAAGRPIIGPSERNIGGGVTHLFEPADPGMVGRHGTDSGTCVRSRSLHGPEELTGSAPLQRRRGTIQRWGPRR